MINKFHDLIGKRFKRLMVIGKAKEYRYKHKWVCQCDCGNTVELPGHLLVHGHRASCGKCKKTYDHEKSFWSCVNKKESCWVWTATKASGGYGILTINRYPVRAHRYSWVIHNGEIPDNLWVLHKCDDPSCVNPDHLFLGNCKDNHDDMDRKGRRNSLSGSKCPAAKLNENQVLEIRTLYNAPYTARELGKKYNVCKQSILEIINRKSWRHI